MDLLQAEKLAYKLIGEHISSNAAYSHWEFDWNNHKTAFGLCDIRKKTIYLSTYLTPHQSEAEVRDTILHEIAHAIDFDTRGYSNHDRKWQRIFISLGGNGQRCGTLDREKAAKLKSKYTFTCSNCGKKPPVHRRPKRKKACGECCQKHNYGRYSAEYALTLTQNY